MFLIDGYNLLFAGPEGKGRDLEGERDGLIRLVSRYCAEAGKKAVAVFDHTKGPPIYGAATRRNEGAVEVRFTRDDLSADRAILDLLAATKDRQAYTVVTSDGEVARAARRAGFEVVSSRDFLKEIAVSLREDPEEAEEKKRNRPPTKGEVDFWMKKFGIKE